MTDNNPYQQPVSELLPDPSHIAFTVSEPARRAVGAGWQWVADAFHLFSMSWGRWIGLFLMFWLLSVVLQLVPVVGPLAATLLGPVFTAGFMYIARQVDIGEELRFGDFFIGFRQQTAPLILLSLLFVLAYILVALVAGGLLAVFFSGDFMAMAEILAENPESIASFEQSGIVMLAFFVLFFMALMLPLMMMYWFAVPLVFFGEQGPWQAMKQSFAGCLRNILPLTWFGIIMLLLLILSVIPLGLGFLVMFPVMMICLYTSFRDIFVKSA